MAYICQLGLKEECNGCGECERIEPCPECGSKEYYARYKKDGEIIGCTNCVKEV